ncbi:glycosyltransferase family 4 protein [Victivallis sp. Marseille-Q1083]|uniref:glycosyltransferase family 4 protein n=1 Tax=Victivallis sp. Marseille-Q1083 TaxID=2717288 RepID=UPI00158CB467|nr:glycosyltransferase family 4 protein [Victivallis sp. Marseille-Q1083]
MNSEKRKLNICHVITRMIVGGAQENTLLTIADHRQKGHRVTLVTGPSPGPEGELLKEVDLPDFEIIEIPSLVRAINPLADWQACRKLQQLFRRRQFDVVHTHSSKAGVVGRAAAWSSRVPVVVHTVHGQAFHRYEKPWKNTLYIQLEKFAARRCDKIFAVAQAMIDDCVRAGVAPREKYMVVYSGMRLEAFLNAQRDPARREQLGIPAAARVIGSVARLFPLKGYDHFLKAAAQVAAVQPDVHFLIVGNGILREWMDREIARLGLTGRFHFAGLVPPDQVGGYIAQMDLLWHLSLREGLPRSVVQALAAGKPAIGYRLDGTPEVLLDGQTGYCVTPESVDEVTERTLELLASPRLAAELGSNGQALVKEYFDWHRMGDILEREYQQLYDRKMTPEFSGK